MRAQNAASSLGRILIAALAVHVLASCVGEQIDVVVAESADGRNPYFPTVERTSEDELLVVYYDSPAHSSQQGRISMVRSEDLGGTWSDPVVVVDSQYDDRDPSIVQLNDGTLLLSYFRTDWDTTPVYIHGTFVQRSEDGGETWSEAVKVQSSLYAPFGGTRHRQGVYQAGFAATSAKILELDDGDLLLPIYGTLPNNSRWRGSVVRSTDGGRTWPIENEVMIPNPETWDLVEPALAQQEDGSVVAILRVGHRDGPAFEAHSEDRGETWSVPSQTDMFAQAPDLLSLESGLILHTWCDISGEFGRGRPVVARTKHAIDGWTKSQSKLIYAGSNEVDQGYPSSIEVSPGNIFTVSYDSPRGVLVGSYWRIDEMDGSQR